MQVNICKHGHFSDLGCDACNEIARLTAERDADRAALSEYRALTRTLEVESHTQAGLLDACKEFLKDGETPAECIARNRTDVLSALGLLAAALRRAEAWKKAAERWSFCKPDGCYQCEKVCKAWELTQAARALDESEVKP